MESLPRLRRARSMPPTSNRQHPSHPPDSPTRTRFTPANPHPTPTQAKGSQEPKTETQIRPNHPQGTPKQARAAPAASPHPTSRASGKGSSSESRASGEHNHPNRESVDGAVDPRTSDRRAPQPYPRTARTPEGRRSRRCRASGARSLSGPSLGGTPPADTRPRVRRTGSPSGRRASSAWRHGAREALRRGCASAFRPRRS